MEGTRNKLTIAICTALTAGALASAGAIAHEVDKAQATATTTPASGTTSSTSSSTATTDRAMDADQSATSAPASQSSTAGYGGATNTSTTASADDTQSSQASSDYDQSRTGTPGSGSNAQGQSDDVVWFVVPVALVSQGDQMSNGCWVRLYSGDNFDGRYVSIVGPTGIRELRSPYGTGLNNWESAVVGPNATVTTYDDEDFRARNATLRAGQRYPDLDDSKLGLFDDIESIKVDCSSASRSGSGS